MAENLGSDGGQVQIVSAQAEHSNCSMLAMALLQLLCGRPEGTSEADVMRKYILRSVVWFAQ